MASPDVNTSYLVTGRLSYGCNDLSADWPHGGTGLGLVGSIYFEPPESFIRLPKEEDNATETVLYVGSDAVLGCSLEGWQDANADGVLDAVLGTAANGTSRQTVSWPGSRVAGAAEPTALSPLVFTPYNDTDHPALILYKAVPMVETSARLALSSYRYLALPLMFVGLADGSDRVAAMGPLTELSL